MLKSTFPELDWEIAVNTRATLMLFDLQGSTRGEVGYFRIIQQARTIS
jgi:hypothetical protein